MEFQETTVRVTMSISLNTTSAKPKSPHLAYAAIQMNFVFEGILKLGPIPWSTGNLLFLRSLNLETNQINRTLPQCFG
ncbi:hypothetical protein CFP56_006427 [Quercus suber]|uniref:Uncharacterized protein n=1 Tax=Quercus suber TaxID=58331 RepID=A0AAW0IED9_QUESU